MLFANRESYDAIISLGGNCAVCNQLRHRGKRLYSLPLDWTLMTDTRPLEYLPTGIKTRFRDLCLEENLSEYEPPTNEHGKTTLHVIDSATGFRFIHHFHGALTDSTEYERVHNVQIRRINRMYRTIESAKHVLFILETGFSYDITLAERIREAIAETFPSVEVELYVMQFSAKRCSEEVLHDGLMRVSTFERPINIVYDNQFTGHEWCWMDRLRVGNAPLPEQRRRQGRLFRIIFKCWFAIGKWLERHGAGCACMRFRDFGKYA